MQNRAFSAYCPTFAGGQAIDPIQISLGSQGLYGPGAAVPVDEHRSAAPPADRLPGRPAVIRRVTGDRIEVGGVAADTITGLAPAGGGKRIEIR